MRQAGIDAMQLRTKSRAIREWARPAPPRRGALSVEAAIVLPVTIFLLLGIVVGGIGALRYQQVAGLAREAARYASVRGSEWARTTAKASPTQEQIRQQAVLPLAAGMDVAKLSTSVEWINPVTGAVLAWNSSTKSPTTLDGDNRAVATHVRVTVTFAWSPGVFLSGAIQMKSVCEIPMSF